MTTRRTRLVGAGAVAVALLVPAAQVSATGMGHSIELHARLHHSAAYAHASGSAEYDRDHSGRDLEITVRVPALAGRSVTVFAAGQRVGRLHLSRTGYGHRDWDTEHGASVPSCRAGSSVRVVRSSNHKLAVSGVFHQHHDD